MVNVGIGLHLGAHPRCPYEERSTRTAMAGVTVRDVLRLALPPGTSVEAGTISITRVVKWVVTPRATAPAFGDLRGEELALISIEIVRTLDPRLTLATLVRRLSQSPVSAIAVVGTIPSDACRIAEQVRMPLLKLPDDSNIWELQREIERLVADYDAQLERRGAQLYNHLTQQSLRQVGTAGLVTILAERTGLSVACYEANGELRSQAGSGPGSLALQALRPNGRQEQTLLDQQIRVEPIGAPEYPQGYLALAGSSLDAWDTLAALQGAAALALEFAKEQAVQAAEDRLRGDFLSMVLAAAPSDYAILTQRGQELGYELRRPHTPLLFALVKSSGAALSRVLSSVQTELTRRSITAPLLRREETVLAMVPVTSEDVRVRELADALRARLVVDYPGVTVAMGSQADALVDWSRTVREAEQAMALGQQLFGAERLLAFSDLGVYRLLVLLRESPVLWTFYRETLAALVEYDQKQGGELLKTLEAYFNHLGNLRATSESLHVHRNTLLYRLDRIEQISGMDLSDAEEHFALWLALRSYRVLMHVSDAASAEGLQTSAGSSARAVK